MLRVFITNKFSTNKCKLQSAKQTHIKFSAGLVDYVYINTALERAYVTKSNQEFCDGWFLVGAHRPHPRDGDMVQMHHETPAMCRRTREEWWSFPHLSKEREPHQRTGGHQ